MGLVICDSILTLLFFCSLLIFLTQPTTKWQPYPTFFLKFNIQRKISQYSENLIGTYILIIGRNILDLYLINISMMSLLKILVLYWTYELCLYVFLSYM